MQPNPLFFNLRMLSGESTVPLELLAEAEDLVKMILNQATYEECLAWIDENF